jgi:hypothetical protein
MGGDQQFQFSWLGMTRPIAIHVAASDFLQVQARLGAKPLEADVASGLGVI